MVQASRFECLSFDLFALFINDFGSSKIDVRWRDVFLAVVIALMIKVLLLLHVQLLLTYLPRFEVFDYVRIDKCYGCNPLQAVHLYLSGRV